MSNTKRRPDCAHCGDFTELDVGRTWTCPHCQTFYTHNVPQGVRIGDDPEASTAVAEKVAAAVSDALIGIKLTVARIAVAQNVDASSLRLRLELANWMEGTRFRGNRYGLGAFHEDGRRTTYALHPQGSEAVARGALEAYQAWRAEGV